MAMSGGISEKRATLIRIKMTGKDGRWVGDNECPVISLPNVMNGLLDEWVACDSMGLVGLGLQGGLSPCCAYTGGLGYGTG